MKKKPEVVVITGASAGVGRASAHRFARDGAWIALLARESPALEQAAEEVRERGGVALPIAVDVADAAQVEAAAERVERELGAIDIWINAAMATVFAPVSEITAEEFRRATEVTYLGTVHGTLSALKRMRQRNRGCIVQVGSALAYRAIPLQAPYCASKFAIRGFTDALRVELIHDRSKVHVTMVQLSAFNTPQFEWARNRLDGRPQPVPPIFQPELAGKGVHWAAHHRRREVCVGFPAVKAILANKWFPSLLDRVLARGAYSEQIDKQPVPEERPGNLFEAVPVDYGTHGRFDARAKASSVQWWLTSNRRALLWGAGALTALVLARTRQQRPLFDKEKLL
ncbi:SDR family NAD(P)-dependent oxidoreductase [Dyella monticola]|uniref:SDR family NAD(P)-dependent oxidoreductase n=1 Tax=Dyella monticola TaxID=1927958 RepID=A0A370WT17_9GAMM|nr:SDR family oxidoreductase [Dyella monticola]RDS79319.1 SDR family NAD(P)-dependent oxidoreductase [Dyella monticola]